ncbi:MAG TPA: winged helix-turn-helix domain-containing protein [Terriglobales bacterium]|nr:winged helix-turn-helix domain-containing protein [Terriglobales bacterium]
MRPAPKSDAVIRFGVFEIDLGSVELRKNGIKVKIQDLPFRALKLLLAHPHEVVSRDRFREALWPEGVYVDFDHGISSAINRLRDALGDSADNPVFVETVERRGYRWIAPTHLPSPPTTVPGPVLVIPDPAELNADRSAKAPASGPNGWRWSLIFPAAALLMVFWVLWPTHRAARAGNAHPANFESQTPRRPANTEAEQFYLRGRFYWQERTPEGLNRAVDAFTQAIVHDPNYAPAYVGLADCYNLLREYTVMPANEAYPRALAAAQRAVELDDQSSEAHASLAFALFYGTWDAAGAEREFRRAIALRPDNAVAHHWYATFLATIGRHPESLVEIERAQTLDPASKAILADKGDLLWAAGRRDEGIALLKQLETTEPGFISPHRYLKTAYFAAGDYANYLEEWKKEAALMQDKPAMKIVETAERAYSAGGIHGMLQSVEDQQKRLYDRGSLSPYSLALTNSQLGNKQEALRYLKIAYDQHDDDLVEMEGEAGFENLHDEPAYKELAAKFRFPKQPL